MRPPSIHIIREKPTKKQEQAREQQGAAQGIGAAQGRDHHGPKGAEDAGAEVADGHDGQGVVGIVRPKPGEKGGDAMAAEQAKGKDGGANGPAFLNGRRHHCDSEVGAPRAFD